MKAVCTLCNKELIISNRVNKDTYVCYVCQYRMDNNLPIKKRGKEGDKRLHKIRDLHAL